MSTMRFIRSIDPWALAGVASMVASAAFMVLLVIAAVTFADARFKAAECARCATDAECAAACGGDGSPE